MSTSLPTTQYLPLNDMTSNDMTRECPKARAPPRGPVDDNVKLEEEGICVRGFALSGT